jgi:rhodanese-related sulfurtransferase
MYNLSYYSLSIVMRSTIVETHTNKKGSRVISGTFGSDGWKSFLSVGVDMNRIGAFFMSLLFGWILASCAPAAELQTIDLASLPRDVNVKTVAQIKNMPEVLVLDVREQFEYNEGHIPGVKLIPMNEVSSRLGEIPTDKTVVVTCRTGNRSSQVADYLRSKGYSKIVNMQGGIVAWQQAGLKVEK